MSDLPATLTRLAETLDIDVRPQPLAETMPMRAFRVDLSRLRLKLGDKTPCLWVSRDQFAAHSPAHLRSAVVEAVMNQGWQRRNTLILVDGDAADLKLLLRSEGLPLFVLDEAAQGRIRAAGAVSRALIEEVSRETPISSLAPYETARPVTGEQFFGREAELRHILQNANNNFLIIGNRRMGKTSLAREALRRASHRSHAHDAHLYIDCSIFKGKLELYAALVRDLDGAREVERVYRDPTFSMPNFLARMAKAKGEKITLVLDEVDGLLEWDARDGWQVMSMFRGVTITSQPVSVSFAPSAAHDAPRAPRGDERQALRLVMVGFRLAQKRAMDRDTPLFNFVETLRVSNFGLGDTEQLVVEPMLNLGIAFVDRSALVARIHRETGGQPNLVQHYCQFIVRRLENTGSREVTPALIDDALDDAALRRRIAGELFENTTNLEQFIVLSYIQNRWQRDANEPFRQSDVDGWLHKRGAQLFRSDLEGALDALEATGFLVRRGKAYSFAFAALPRMIVENYEVRYQINKIMEEGLS